MCSTCSHPHPPYPSETSETCSEYKTEGVGAKGKGRRKSEGKEKDTARVCLCKLLS